MASKEKNDAKKKLQKSYFDVLGLCCSSEVPLIENILKPVDGIKEVSVIVPSRTVIIVHDSMVISQLQIAKALNEARLEATIRVRGDELKHRKRWPSPHALASGLLLFLSFLKYVYHPLQYLALGAVAAGAFPITLKAIASVRNLRLDINILMIIAVVGTIAMRDYLEAGTIVFLFSIAEWLESRASHKASAVMSSLMNITPQKAVIAETGEVVDADEVKVNTVLAVKAGEVIPMDGVVVEGKCEVDEKTLTGESFLVPKQKDSTVWAGTINLNGYISVKTTALAEDSVVAKMAKLVEEAQNSKTSTQRLIDQFAKYYTPAVVIISVLLAVIPVVLGVHNQKHWFHFALVVLVSACPCALILSTPVATFCAYTKAATSGLLIKGGDYLETLAKIKIMGFDKTGTITKGEFVVTNFESLRDDVDLNSLIYWVASIESKSSHPMAAAIVNYGRLFSIELKPENVTEFENFPGEGIHGRIDERDLYIGNRKIAMRAGSETVPALQGDNHGKTAGYIYSGATPIGFFSLSDACRSGVQEAIGKLELLGVKTAMLTGDSQAAAMQAQEQLGHSLELVYAELLPEDKVKIITEFKKEGPTAMIGDGINDAPALATADIGISMGISGSALASETGDIILMSNDIRKIPEAIKLARKSHRKVIENVILAVTTKAAIIVLAFAGHPLVWAAVLADVGTCLLVILNSMVLLRKGNGHRGKCCRSSSQLGVNKNECHAPNGKSSHHHHHHHHHHNHHSHQRCCSEKIKEACLTENFTSQQCASMCKSSPSNSSLVGNSKNDIITGNQDKCKGNVESHEPNRCHHRGCESKHGVHSHDIKNQGCSHSHGLILVVDDKCANLLNSQGTCLDKNKCQGTLHSHCSKCDMTAHAPCHFSTLKESCRDHHLIDGCEFKEDRELEKIMQCYHNSQHQNPEPHSDFKKHWADHTFIDIILDDEHIDAASMCACTSVKDKGSCCKECPEICRKFPVVQAVASSIENKTDPCCRSCCCSKESVGFPPAHACASFDKREMGGCCKSYMKECCGNHGHLGAGFGGGGLPKIITE